MRLVLALALMPALAAADPMLYEWNAATPRRAAEQLHLGACAIDATFHGAIADFELRQHIANPTAAELASAFELALPQGAKLIGVAIDRATSVGVPVNSPAMARESTDILGGDPAIATHVGTDDRDRELYRVIMKPLASEREVTLALRWTQVAEIRDGALHARVLGRPDGVSCVVTTKAAAVANATLKAPPVFTMSTDDVVIEVPVKITAPVAWLASTDLGDGKVARALTVLAPAARAETGPHRAVFVIDTSRSMELVGRGTVRKLVAAVAAALPQGSEIEAVLFDRKAERVLGTWAPNDAKSLAAIDQALAKHAATNGSDIAEAFAVAHAALAAPNGPRNQALVIAITDGVLGQSSPDELAKQLGPTTGLDLYALVISPGGMTTPDGDSLRVLTSTYGGSYLAETVDQIDGALVDLASWLRPAWQDVSVAAWTAPAEIRAGTGFTMLGVTDPNARFAVKLRGDRALVVQPAPITAPIAQLALDHRDDADEPKPDEERSRAKLTQRFPAADRDHDLVVLSAIGKVAAQRRQMISAGGPFTRIVETPDPDFAAIAKQAATKPNGGSSLDRTIIKRLLNDQLQPHAYSCYARSLGRMIKLAGTATFEIAMGRGEVTHVAVGGFETNPEFAACLADAAYGIAPPLPTPGFNTDDRTIVTYALTFTMRDNKPEVAATTDATVAPQAAPTTGPRPALDVDPSTPLGGIRP